MIKTFYFLNRPLKVILLAKRNINIFKAFETYAMLLKITQWKEQDTSIYIPQMPFVKLCLLSQQKKKKKKKGVLISFCISVFSEVEFFFHSILCLKKHSYPLWILFSIFFFWPTWVLFHHNIISLTMSVCQHCPHT